MGFPVHSIAKENLNESEKKQDQTTTAWTTIRKIKTLLFQTSLYKNFKKLFPLFNNVCFNLVIKFRPERGIFIFVDNDLQDSFHCGRPYY